MGRSSTAESRVDGTGVGRNTAAKSQGKSKVVRSQAGMTGDKGTLKNLNAQASCLIFSRFCVIFNGSVGRVFFFQA